ncbi:GntR family transcriptional regulator [Leifsonia xyli subsp. cynodontis DSM 46306]|uniref:HTH gntR-type domain-containing protein n=1 Tax=Leifsonia xyli subsp. cynodontis DSM 46306 TaxID=1389489 RepID=U3P7P1_LEIXC|nr:GntR family transcriptional regulator [Leifsonia xyli]AGW40932.1 GntR family transcriptional regulator [Leifsonia xyli subsp. cynodontis DSM 46306]
MKVPLHETVRTALRERILNGGLPAGASLPSEAELCAQFGASRGPVRQALTALSTEGLIETSQGRVPIVARAPLAHAIDDFFSFSSWVRDLGRTPGQRTIEIALRQPRARIALALALADGEQAVELVRVRSIDGEPVMIERTAFAERVGRLLFEFDPDAGSLFDALLARGAPLDRGEHTIDAVAADELDAAELGVALAAPLLRVRRVTTSDDGDILEVSDDRYRPDRAALIIHNSRSRSLPRPLVARSMTSEGTA